MSDPQQITFLDSIEAPLHALLSPDEMFRRMDAKLLTELREDRRLERKPPRIGEPELGTYFSMWANTAPTGGIIVIGVGDKGTLEGLTAVGHDKLNKLELCGATYCPEAIYEAKRIQVTNTRGQQDFVLVFRVFYHDSRVVKTTKGEAYIRRADTRHKLTPEEVRELQAEKKEVSFELEACSLSYPSDFDRAAIRGFVQRVRNARAWSEDHSEEDVLVLMKLGKIASGTFQPNVACALLFATDPRDLVPGCRVRFLRFDGDEEGTGERWNAVRDEFIDGTVAQLISGTANAIASQVRTFSRLDPNGKFYTQTEYPSTAWYEAIVNACVHRSYGNGLKNTPIFVKMFDNRLVIESPGPFPPFVTPENIYDMHNPKNPFLMEALRYLEFVKCAHEGTRRMKATMLEMALPSPEFKQDQIGHSLVRVILRNNVDQRKAWVDRDVADLVGTMLAKSLTENERRFLNFCAEHGEIGVSDAQRLTNSTWPAAKKALMKLVGKGILRHDIRKHLDRDPQARFRFNRDED